ncbi:NUDIX hydrolase domain-like protein [Phialemonium atrogriseum]|uniref:NUDIX hydrolase domain-like protein n=1 Tax=Phialemonium atrogriseum TaxID=1093897 RepID=A0AAJ0C7A7_9PEZI|nr:NUDIX hydrolase domain-like protein [Phialemonium atrogriseum]KAK1769011.1 NUDIX hydrolase domain-like protein [Phialemonium atrogriseum]
MTTKEDSPGPPPPPTLVFTSDVSVSSYAVSVETYLSAHPEFDALAVGAIVFSTTPPANPEARDHVLLIQRAAHDSMPSRWEVPGGGCDLDDESILHGLGRELWEESGLVLTAVITQVGDGRVFFTRRGQRVCKYTFEAEVQAQDGVVPGVTLDPKEHQAYLWATEDECRARRKGDVELKFTTKDEEAAIMEAFRLRRVRRDAVAKAEGGQVQEQQA